MKQQITLFTQKQSVLNTIQQELNQLEKEKSLVEKKMSDIATRIEKENIKNMIDNSFLIGYSKIYEKEKQGLILIKNMIVFQNDEMIAFKINPIINNEINDEKFDSINKIIPLLPTYKLNIPNKKTALNARLAELDIINYTYNKIYLLCHEKGYYILAITTENQHISNNFEKLEDVKLFLKDIFDC